MGFILWRPSSEVFSRQVASVEIEAITPMGEVWNRTEDGRRHSWYGVQ